MIKKILPSTRTLKRHCNLLIYVCHSFYDTLYMLGKLLLIITFTELCTNV